MGRITLPRSGREELVKALALAGGEAIRGSSRAQGVGEKEGRGNLVTAADRASEQAILRRLAEEYPHDRILSEESRPSVGRAAGAAHLWVIDPLDGTNNFRFGRPYSAVSVAYVEGGVPRAGAVYDPFREELFFAVRGRGAALNGEAIRVSRSRDLSSASVATDNCYDPAGTRRNLGLVLRIQPCPWVLVRGSAVLGMCEVACGRTDLYFHTSLQPWDNAAAFLIVREAGGRVLGFDGAEVDFFAPAAIVGNAGLVEACRRYLTPSVDS
jgi:myo-inositol-1(or 4)-monophosphatase